MHWSWRSGRSHVRQDLEHCAGLAILLLQLRALCPFCQWDTTYPSLLSLLTEQLVCSNLCARGFMVQMMLYFGCVRHTNLMHIDLCCDRRKTRIE